MLHLVTLGATHVNEACTCGCSSRASTPPPPKASRCSGRCPCSVSCTPAHRRQHPRRAGGPPASPKRSRTLERAAELAGAGGVDVGAVPVGRLKILARQGLGGARRCFAGCRSGDGVATLLTTTRTLQVAAIDDVLDLFAVLVGHQAERVGRADQRAGPAAVGPVPWPPRTSTTGRTSTFTPGSSTRRARSHIVRYQASHDITSLIG